MMLISAGVSLIGGAVQAGNASREAQMNAEELDRSARQAEAAQLDAVRRGAIAESRRRLEVGQVRGAQQVAYAASGVDASTGTPAQVGAASDVMGEMDAQTLRLNAIREAFGFAETARSMRIRARQTRDNAGAGVFNAIAGGVGGAVQTGAQVFRPPRGG
jgi:hypothetical protein